MILADTSVWVEFLHQRLPGMGTLLRAQEIRAHPWVTVEISLGNLRDRDDVLGRIHELASVAVASTEEMRTLADRHRLHGCGIGFVDLQLIASALVSDCRLWTLDRRLGAAARDVGVRMFDSP